jgi:hypothetical protein
VQMFTMCMECMKELGRPSFEPFLVPYYDDRVGYVECSRGHKSAILLQSHKFEVLLESGASALAAGFTLEAASTFSAALERFYEFCLQVLSTQRNMSSAVYEQMFKPMARQSERQLGAFMALHAVELGIAYSPNHRIAEFRNNVIHKGQIPTPEEAYDFCGKVYAEIFNLYETFSKTFSTAVQDVAARDLTARSNQLPKGTPTATVSGTMFFSMARSENKPTFREALDEYINTTERLIGAVPYFKALHLGLSWLAPKHDNAAK